MKVGDLVKPATPANASPCQTSTPTVEQGWYGIIIDFTEVTPLSGPPHSGKFPVVYWNPEFQAEVEYPDQIEVVNESR